MFDTTESSVNWGLIAYVLSTFSLITVYCFGLHRKPLVGNVLYIIGFGAYGIIQAEKAVLYAYHRLIDERIFLYAFLVSVFAFAFCFFIILGKIKMNTSIAVAGLMALSAYTAMTVAALFANSYMVPAWQWTECLCSGAQIVAFANLWGLAVQTIPTSKLTVPPSEDLVSTESRLRSLKQLYDNGMITEEEYRQKKADVLDKL